MSNRLFYCTLFAGISLLLIGFKLMNIGWYADKIIQEIYYCMIIVTFFILTLNDKDKPPILFNISASILWPLIWSSAILIVISKIFIPVGSIKNFD